MKGTFSRVLQYIVPIAFLLGGLLFIAMGVIRIHNYNTFKDTVGEIVAIHNYYDSDDSPRTDVYVRYTVDGETYDSMLDESRSSYRKGQTVNIRYNPEKPSQIMTARLGPSFIPIGFGVLSFVLGLIALIQIFKRRTPAAAKPPWES